jgi:SCF-associated factor 1
VRFPDDSGESGGNAGVELSGEGDEKAGAAFVFSITAAGWHTGALMLGDPAQSVEEGGNAAETGGGEVESEVPLGQENTRDLLGMPDAFSTRGSAIFRVGFPGRGTGVGQIAQRAWRARAGTGQEGVGGNVDGEGDGDAESLGGAGPWAMNDRFH